MTLTIKCDEIGFQKGDFHSFEETRQYIESKTNEALSNANTFEVIEDDNGEITVHKYFKIVFPNK